MNRTLEQKKKRCVGCYNDFYNHGNNSSSGHCWSLESAKLVMKKEVSINQRPPWNQKAKRLFDCYHAQGFVYVDAKTER